MKLQYLLTRKQDTLSGKFLSNIKEELDDEENKIIVEIDKRLYIHTFYIKGDNEKAAKKLSEINDRILKNDNKMICISNEASAYFNKNLFPLFNEFERNLRKIVFLGLSIIEEIDENTVKIMEEKDFGGIFGFLFFDSNFLKKVKELDIKQVRKAEIIEKINNIGENTRWNKLFPKSSLLLENEFNSVREYRNDTMHARNIDFNRFKLIKKLLQDINVELEEEINRIIGNPNNYRFKQVFVEMYVDSTKDVSDPFIEVNIEKLKK